MVNQILPPVDWIRPLAAKPDLSTHNAVRETPRTTADHPNSLRPNQRVREGLRRDGLLPEAGEAAERIVEAELRDRVRTSGKTNLSRAISELVAAGLIRRHYKGFAVDYINRGGQRLAVYAMTGRSRCLLPAPLPSPRTQQQLTLGF